jgi:hypothetical protein
MPSDGFRESQRLVSLCNFHLEEIQQATEIATLPYFAQRWKNDSIFPRVQGCRIASAHSVQKLRKPSLRAPSSAAADFPPQRGPATAGDGAM